MNRRGVALAANMPEMLFPIAPDLPVTIVTFGAHDMMGVPWETIIHTYTQQHANRTYGTLEAYAANFFAFIEGSSAPFTPQLQAACVRRCVASVWADYRDRIEAAGDQRATWSGAQRRAELGTILQEDRHDLESRPHLPSPHAEYGAHVVASYGQQIDELETEIFGDMELTPQLRAELRSVLALMYAKEWLHPDDESGIAFAGMGDDEPFPSVLVYAVGTVAAGHLRRTQRRSVNIGFDCDSGVVSFAQNETVDTIVDGIHPDLLAATHGEVKRDLQTQVEEHHTAPFMAAVARLPRRDMVQMAEALVTVSAFAEPAGVAMLSKGSGFTWVTHGDPIRYQSQELNYGTARSE